MLAKSEQTLYTMYKPVNPCPYVGTMVTGWPLVPTVPGAHTGRRQHGSLGLSASVQPVGSVPNDGHLAAQGGRVFEKQVPCMNIDRRTHEYGQYENLSTRVWVACVL